MKTATEAYQTLARIRTLFSVKYEWTVTDQGYVIRVTLKTDCFKTLISVNNFSQRFFIRANTKRTYLICSVERSPVVRAQDHRQAYWLCLYLSPP